MLFFFFSAEDKAYAKKGLVSYAYNLRFSLTKLEGAVAAVNEAIKWLDASQEASKDEYKEKLMELEEIVEYFQLLLTSKFFFVHSFFSPALSYKDSTVLYMAISLVIIFLPAYKCDLIVLRC